MAKQTATARLACVLVLASLGALFVATSSAHAATVTGMNGVTASIYGNPFDPDDDGVTTGAEATTTSFSAIGGGTVNSFTTPERVVNRVDSRTGAGGRLTSSAGDASSGFMQYTAANSFQVGTVISAQFVASGFDTVMPFDLKLDGEIVQSGPGTVDLHPYQVTDFGNAQLRTVSTLRIEEDLVTFSSGTPRLGDFAEVLLLSDPLEVIPVASISATTPDFGSIPGINDFDGTHAASGTVGGWAVSTPPLDAGFFQLDFEQTETVRALLMSNWENIAVSGSILDDTDTVIAEFTMAAGSGVGDILPIRFDTPVTTSLLRVVFDGDAAIGMREAIPLREVFFQVPEPSTCALFGLGGLGLMMVRRRRRGTRAAALGQETTCASAPSGGRSHNVSRGVAVALAVAVICVVVAGRAHALTIAATDFDGRTVSGATASNLTWTGIGIADPGDLTTDAPDGLFNTLAAQDRFVPDRNLVTEGPWSVTIPLNVSAGSLSASLESMAFDFFYYSNAGDTFTTDDRQSSYAATLTGSSSGLLATASSGIFDVSAGGSVLLTFASPVELTKSETYELTLDVSSTDTLGVNAGIDNLVFSGTQIPAPEPTTCVLLAFGAVSLVARRRRRRPRA